jgi:hypothetical protein
MSKRRQPMREHINERIATNRQRVEQAREREDREARFIRELAQATTNEQENQK